MFITIVFNISYLDLKMNDISKRQAGTVLWCTWAFKSEGKTRQKTDKGSQSFIENHGSVT